MQKGLKSYQEMLEYAFDVFNRVYFNNELPPIVICIMSSKNTYGHFTVNKEWRVDDEHLHELCVSAEHLDRPIANVLGTLQHELIHYYCALHGIKDTSQGHRYHNKNFKREAEARGLIISQAPYIGWSVTQPSPEFIEVIRSNGIEKPLDINRDGYTGVMVGRGGDGDGDGNTVAGPNGLPTAKKKTSTRKYVCPKCGNSFRATKDIHVLCMDCNEKFVKVEK
jgi:DNA-directed RNA polymerase subunit RPC12/RpoP